MLDDRRIRLLAKKMADAQQIVQEALQRYGAGRLAVAWTGGKDSTLVLYIVRQACREAGTPLPPCFCIDEGDMFPEIRAFIERVGAQWDADVRMLHNDDVSRAAGGRMGAGVRVADLDARNRAEIERLGYDEDAFIYEPESFVGNHLMKTAVLNRYLFDSGVAGFFGGIRWDEQAARADETHISPREATPCSPTHVRISPILHFTERDVWDTTHHLGIPYCALYAEGYRSLGARVTTVKIGDVPAWEQDLENTSERGGRRQDKEALMAKFRDLGYM